MVKILKIGSPNHGFQWFLMVVHHRSNNAMVMVTYHCSSLSYSYYMVFLVSRNWRAVFVSNSFCTKFEEIINLQRLYIEMLQCGSNDEVIKGNLCSMNCENGNRSTSKNINVALYDEDCDKVRCRDAQGSLFCFGAGRGEQKNFFRCGAGRGRE